MIKPIAFFVPSIAPVTTPVFTSQVAKDHATKVVELIADCAATIGYLKTMLPSQFIDRAEFVIRELNDMAEVMDGTMNLGLYQAADVTRQFPGQKGEK
ncbi:hypothetical protein [Propionivibrio sp.]|uniref:hypothetical protein n=1 Tax=Propionivibrio sp. TaxID=2212460 RepID=UPI003BF03339